MFNITTKYDKIYDETTSKYVRKKVFMIRGDEAYAKTTDTILTNSTPVSGDSKGWKTNLTATVHRKTGASKVVFYDGEEILGMVDIGSGVSTVYLNNIYLSYGIGHELYAVFKGNDSCLGSKSSKINISVPVPPELLPIISFNNTVSQIDEGEDPTINVTVTLNNEPVKNTPIIFYVNNEYLKTVNTDTNGNITFSLGELNKGIYTITASLEGIVSFNNATNNHTILSGYNIEFIEYPSTVINNTDYTIKVKCSDLYGNPLYDDRVLMLNQFIPTDGNGVAQYSGQVNLDTPKLTASVHYSSTEVNVDLFTPSNITVTTDDNIIANDIEGTYTINLNGTGTMNNVPVILNYGFRNETLYFSDNVPQTINIKGQSAGEVIINLKISGSSTILNRYVYYDTIQYYTPFKQYNFNYTTNGDVSSSTTGLLFKGSSNTYLRFESDISYYLKHQPYTHHSFINQQNRTLEFDVVGATNTEFKLGFESHDFIACTFTTGDHVKITYSHLANELTLNVNGNTVDYIDYTLSLDVVNKWIIKTSNENVDNTLKITNLKIY